MILTLVNVKYKESKDNNMANFFACTTTTINFMAITQFYKTIYVDILKYLFTSGFKNGSLLKLILTYFRIVKINS